MELSIDDVIDFLGTIAASLEMDEVHWVCGSDQGKNWCLGCCRYKVRHLRRRNKKNRDTYLVDGGWGGSEEDNPAFCVGCGEPLHYTLTEYGVRGEMEHFLENGFLSEDGAISPHTAYELREMFWGGQYSTDMAADLLILAGQVRNCMAVAKNDK